MNNIEKKEKVDFTINKYSKTIGKKTLILCHGKNHKKKFKNALTLNRNYNVNPDLVLSAWKEKF